MKQVFSKSFYVLLLLTALLYLGACQKDTVNQTTKQLRKTAARNEGTNGYLQQTKTFSSDVAIRWLNQQLDMLRVPLAPGTGSQGADRCQAYCGIALYEAVVPGMPAYQSLSGQLTDFPQMPATEPGKAYHWAASANAALAEMNRRLFPATADVNKTNMNNLENALQSQYATETDDATLQRSIAFGKEVASKVFDWAATDGSSHGGDPYTVQVGFGLWVPTPPPPPGPQAPVNSHADLRRLLVPNVANGTELDPPPAYSELPGSPFWEMAKDVYDKSIALTDDQKAMAVYHRDAPGYPGGGHFVALLSQVFNKVQPSLDIAALAYVKVGLGQNDAGLICFRNKYNYLQVRPITYIRNVMGYTTWSPYIPTPNHPEFPSAHGVNNGAVMAMLTNVFGDNFQITLHTYDYLGLPARSYNSFEEMGKEMGDSRVFGGIHYQASCDKGIAQGKKVAVNILNTIKFLKE